MSHLKERTEKNCLNCNANLHGRYCHVCGQENLEPKESVWHLVTHFFNDITHFDGKFFSTVKLLITKPGFLSKEYMLGRRASYLNPIRMYVFTSAIFFLIFFSLKTEDKIVNINDSDNSSKAANKEGINDWENQKNILEKKLTTNSDKDVTDEIKDSINDLNENIIAAKKIYGDTTTKKFNDEELGLILVRTNLNKQKNIPKNVIVKMDSSFKKRAQKGDTTEDVWDSYKSLSDYDSVQQKLPESKKDGWFMNLVHRKVIAANEQRLKDKKSYFEHFKESLVHSFPKILFISLPFFALILKFVYIRRKQFYYTNHGIFAIHLYCAIFILLLALLILNKLTDSIPWTWFKVVNVIIGIAMWIYIFFYTYKAMRTFYMQRRLKTFLKYCIVGFLAFIINLIIFLIFILISAIYV